MERFHRHLQEVAVEEAATFEAMLGLLALSPDLKGLKKLARPVWPEWERRSKRTLLDTNVAAYVARLREWGLL